MSTASHHPAVARGSERTSFIVGIAISGALVGLLCFLELIQAGLSRTGTDGGNINAYLRVQAFWTGWLSAGGWGLALILGLIFKTRYWGWAFGAGALILMIFLWLYVPDFVPESYQQ